MNGNTFRLSQNLLQGSEQQRSPMKDFFGKLVRRDFFEKNVRLLVSKMRERVRKVLEISPVSIRGKKFTKYSFAEARA